MPRVWSRMVLYRLREITFRLQIYVHKSSIKDSHNVNFNFEQYFLLKDNLLKTSRKNLYPDIAVFAYICSEVRKHQFFSLLAISIGRQRKMASTACSIFCFPRKTYREVHFTHSFVVHSSLEMIPPRMKTAEKTGEIYLGGDEAADKVSGLLNRRSLLASGAFLVSSVTALGLPRQSFGIVKQGPLAGRVPGLSEPNEQGWRTYRRPDEKSGGHGVGWSPIIPYAFSVPEGWDEVPVSIADLGGTEIDLRFGNSKQGKLSVIVAPVLRFADNLGDDATIEKIGPPEKVINAFGPEVIGENVEGKVVSMGVAKHLGRMYYQFELEPPHVLITATAAGNRLYLFNVTGSGLQWKRHYPDLKRIADSFRVV